jgi:hypothetical protein
MAKNTAWDYLFRASMGKQKKFFKRFWPGVDADIRVTDLLDDQGPESFENKIIINIQKVINNQIMLYFCQGRQSMWCHCQCRELFCDKNFANVNTLEYLHQQSFNHKTAHDNDSDIICFDYFADIMFKSI